MLAVQRGCLSSDIFESPLRRLWGLVEHVVLVVEGHVGGDEDRNGEGCAELQKKLEPSFFLSNGKPGNAAYLTNVTIRIVELDPEPELVPDLDASGVRVLQTLGEGLGQSKEARELITLGGFVDDFQVVVWVELVFIADNCSGVLV